MCIGPQHVLNSTSPSPPPQAASRHKCSYLVSDSPPHVYYDFAVYSQPNWHTIGSEFECVGVLGV